MKTYFSNRTSFGINKTINCIIDVILAEIPHAYIGWLELSITRRYRLKSEIRNTLKRQLLGQKFLKALAKDILKDGKIDVDSAVYQYLKSTVYKGNIRMLLTELESARGK